MEATLQALADLLVKSTPTIIFFIALTVYLKYMFFRPMARLLEERRRQTEGVRELAQRAFEAADRRTSEFEHALQLARAQIAQENDALRRQWAEEQTEALAEARGAAQRKLEEARHVIADEVEKAKTELDASIESLSSRIVNSLVGERAA
jgi:F0F1-type ATP synthase membrane subunit b/b'